MKLSFNLNAKDYIDFNLYHIQYSESTRKKLNSQRLMGSLSFIILGGASLFTGVQSQLIFGGIMIAFGVFWYYNFPNFAKKRIKKSTEKAIEKGKLKDLFADITIEISDDGLKEINNQGDYQLTWDDVHSVVFLDEYVYVFLKDHGAMVVPYRVLEGEEKEELQLLIERNFKGTIDHLEVTLS